MTEIPKRFTKAEVYRAEVASGEYGADIPELLNDTQVLRAWGVLGRLLPDSILADQIQEVSDATRHSSSDTKFAYSAWKPESQIELVQKILDEVKSVDGINPLLEELLLAEVAKRCVLDIDVYIQKVKAMTDAVSRSPASLYIAGEDLGTKHTRPRIGFGGKLLDFALIQNSELKNPAIEPVVEGIDGSAGLFPRGVFFTGVYAVQEVMRASKKYYLDHASDVTDEEKQEELTLPVDLDENFDLVRGVFRPRYMQSLK